MYFNLAKHHNVVRLVLVEFMLNARKKAKDTCVAYITCKKFVSSLSSFVFWQIIPIYATRVYKCVACDVYFCHDNYID